MTDPRSFESLYRGDVDPWRFASSPYELSRYDAIVDAAGSGPFARAFEPGCSIGVLTYRLVSVADHVTAIDVSSTAVERARARCAGLADVHVEVGAFPGWLPSEPCDLLVLSEVLYYFPIEAFDVLADAVRRVLRSGGRLVACHWTGSSADHAIGGEVAHAQLRSRLHPEPCATEVVADPDHDGYLLETWDL